MSARQTAASFPFDARALTDPVDRATVKAHRERLRREGRLPQSSSISAVLSIVLLVIVGMVFGGTALMMLAGVVTSAAQGHAVPWPMWIMVVVPGLVALGVLAVAWFTVFGNRTAERRYRLDAFARANSMEWHAVSANPPLPGMIFGLGSDRKALDVVRGHQPRFVEFGNHRYTVSSGKNSTTYHWGYVAVKLSSPLPHIVLDARSNNSFFGSNLPAVFHKDQVLSLEGDFDRYFTLYCPREYERDALYLFTPDIMARFIDNAAALDVEVVDDWMFLYAKRDFSTLDPVTWAWLFSVVGAFLDKFAQWERWRDERLAHRASLPPAAPSRPAVAGAAPHAAGAAPHDTLPFAAPVAPLRPPPGVARQGRRLQRGIPWPAIVIAVIGILLAFFGNSIGILDVIFRR
ncbi:hypothetical protein [Microbacterium sp. No. 7]|uniref:hypothetical protein n=1 Tax=Microbacterium sp. No. 7 TaxID=1714373 RepID=UPI0006D0BFC1|nr:hypothetical protein [Microbacterium sp. No. 7]ALJ22285.1 hypothetical protein AOA12_21315 [Microbacterium sp. No. 7]